MIHHRWLIPHVSVGTGIVVVDVPAAEDDTRVPGSLADQFPEQAHFSQCLGSLVRAWNAPT
ncbi:hypothetical protein [Arthrobacter alpinus]|uniref:hypothetical protein n=1 Tax=Arthrobacter alpinus TaxID=656366 RepID=UPI001FCCD506|nr:hypothetical protein [Arthrobacter alpinus]